MPRRRLPKYGLAPALIGQILTASLALKYWFEWDTQSVGFSALTCAVCTGVLCYALSMHLRDKGYPRSWGWLGLLSFIGALAVMYLSDRTTHQRGFAVNPAPPPADVP